MYGRSGLCQLSGSRWRWQLAAALQPVHGRCFIRGREVGEGPSTMADYSFEDAPDFDILLIRAVSARAAVSDDSLLGKIEAMSGKADVTATVCTVCSPCSNRLARRSTATSNKVAGTGCSSGDRMSTGNVRRAGSTTVTSSRLPGFQQGSIISPDRTDARRELPRIRPGSWVSGTGIL